MDFLSKMLIQLRELFMSMTPAARITTGLLLAVVLCSVFYLFRFQSGSPDHYLFSGGKLTSEEVANIAGELGSAGLKFKIEGNQILIPSGQEEKYFAALSKAKALPVNWADIKAQAMADSSPWSSSSQRKQKTKLATEKALSYAIRNMNDVENASVMYDIKTKGGLDRETVASAVVSVKPSGSSSLSNQRVEDIKHTVAGGVAGLEASNITVNDQNGRTHPASSTGNPAEEMTNQYKKLKISYEKDLTDKVYNLLNMVPGVAVTVRFELDPTAQQSSHEVKLEPKGLNTSTTENTRITSDEGTTQGNVPGARSNTANAKASLGKTSGSKKTEDISSTDIKTKPQGIETTKTLAGMTPTRAKVSVSIPRSYFVRVWRLATNKTEDDEIDNNAVNQVESDEIKKIRSSILPLLPMMNNEPDPLLNVTVNSFPDPPEVVIEEPTFSGTAMDWFGQNWSSVGMATLGLFSLLVLRSMVKSSTTSTSEPTTSDATPAAAAAAVAAPEGDEDADEVVNRLMGRRGDSERSMKEDLVDMVKEDPDTAASILKSWISDN